MTKTQAWMAVIILVGIFIVAEVVLHSNSQPQGATAEQVTAANDCITLCQTVYDESGGAPSSQEQTCENACNKSAGIATSTSSQ